MSKAKDSRSAPLPSPRDQMVAGAADLLRRHGVGATSLREVVRHTRTPRGSLGHYFPGGKAQLLEEAVDYARHYVSTALAAVLERAGAVEGLAAFVQHWRKTLQSTEYAAGCAVLPLALEPGVDAEVDGPGGERLKARASAAFDEWSGLLANALVREGVPVDRAQSLGTLTVASLEGAIALSRVARSCAPLDRVAAELERAVATALDGARLAPKRRGGR